MNEENPLDAHPDLADPEWRKHAQLDAWLGAKQDHRRQRRRARRAHGRWRWGPLALVVCVALTIGAIILAGRLADRRPATPAAPNPTMVPDVAPVDLAHPYAHTPADVWKKGVDGITSPAPAAVGAFGAEAVADAYAQVRLAIVAANLDPAVLYRHDPKPLLDLLAPDAREQLAPVLTGKGTEFAAYLTEIADGYRLLDQGPRTFGTLTARAGAKPGELVVDAKYSIAYAFDKDHPQDLTSPGEIVSFLRTDQTYIVRSGAEFDRSSHGLWLDVGQGAYSSVGCAAAKDGYLAPGYANPPVTGPGGGDRDAPGYYDPKYPVPDIDSCPA